jgi:hypothetical protein
MEPPTVHGSKSRISLRTVEIVEDSAPTKQLALAVTSGGAGADSVAKIDFSWLVVLKFEPAVTSITPGPLGGERGISPRTFRADRCARIVPKQPTLSCSLMHYDTTPQTQKNNGISKFTLSFHLVRLHAKASTSIRNREVAGSSPALGSSFSRVRLGHMGAGQIGHLVSSTPHLSDFPCQLNWSLQHRLS